MVKLTLEFKSVDEAIVALGKLAGLKTSAAPVVPVAKADQGSKDGSTPAPAAAEPAPQRKPRADKGQKRGAYAPRQETTGAGTGASTATETASNGSTGTTDVSASTTPAAPLANTVDRAAAAPTTIEDVQAALNDLYTAKGHDVSMQVLSRFGVNRAKNLLPGAYAEFVAKARAVIAGEAP